MTRSSTFSAAFPFIVSPMVRETDGNLKAVNQGMLVKKKKESAVQQEIAKSIVGMLQTQ